MVLQKGLDVAGVEARDIVYHEAHGTGTALGDPIEIRSLAKIHKNRQNNLLVGAVKTNVGHLEGFGAGMIGLIKSVLILQNRIVPQNLQHESS